MPTSEDEAKAIVDIIADYLDRDMAKELCGRLHSEVGSSTDNISLRVSLEMLNAAYVHGDPGKI
jgi:hypothetical protein